MTRHTNIASAKQTCTHCVYWNTLTTKENKSCNISDIDLLYNQRDDKKCEELSREKSWNSGDQVKTRPFCSNIILHSAHIPDVFINDIWVQQCKRQKFALT
jgi:hypothetical protein